MSERIVDGLIRELNAAAEKYDVSMRRGAKNLEDALRERISALEDDLAEYHRLQKGCPACLKGEPARALIDDDGVLAAISGKPGQWGHSWDDYHWYCADAGAIAENEQLRDDILFSIGALSAGMDSERQLELSKRLERALAGKTSRIPGSVVDVVFDGPPGPESGRFVEVEDADGKSISVGDWVDRGDGYHVLRLRLAQ